MKEVVGILGKGFILFCKIREMCGYMVCLGYRSIEVV